MNHKNHAPPVCVLALDLGNNTGWALLHRDGRISYGSERMKLSQKEAVGKRYYRFKRFLIEVKSSGNPDHVIYEDVPFIGSRFDKKTNASVQVGSRSAQNWAGYEAILTYWCEHHQIPYHRVHVATLKKTLTGSGRAEKKQMIAAVREQGFAPPDDNAADALAALIFFQRMIAPDFQA